MSLGFAFFALIVKDQGGKFVAVDAKDYITRNRYPTP